MNSKLELLAEWFLFAGTITAGAVALHCAAPGTRQVSVALLVAILALYARASVK